MKKQIKLLIASGLSVGLAILFFLNTFKIPKAAARTPRVLITLIIILSIGMVIEGYIKKDKKDESKNHKELKTEEDGGKVVKKPNYLQVIIFTAIIAVYIISIKYIGYFIVTPIYVIVNYLFLKATSIKNMVLVSAGFTIFVYLVFVVFLRLPIPMGIFG